MPHIRIKSLSHSSPERRKNTHVSTDHQSDGHDNALMYKKNASLSTAFVECRTLFVLYYVILGKLHCIMVRCFRYHPAGVSVPQWGRMAEGSKPGPARKYKGILSNQVHVNKILCLTNGDTTRFSRELFIFDVEVCASFVWCRLKAITLH